jgi:putative SOS response-associated peptidase YedK
MCGRYTITRDLSALQPRFDFQTEADTIAPRYNLAPTQNAPVVILRDGVRVLKLMRWGLIPHWADDASVGNRLINARSETIAQKTSFREPFQKRRCLVIADGFYEWQRAGKTKIPMRIRLIDGAPFAFAGLWNRWTDPKTGAIDAFTIITTQANDLLKPIHDRMPVIIPADREAGWLDPHLDPADALQMLTPFPSDQMTAYPVSTLVNSPRNDHPDCIEPQP